MRSTLLLAASIFVMLLMAGCDELNDAVKPGASLAASPDVARQKFQQITLDPTLSDAERIMGSKGQLVAYNELPSPEKYALHAYDSRGAGNPYCELANFYIWGAIAQDNFLVIAATKDEPHLVKRKHLKIRSDDVAPGKKPFSFDFAEGCPVTTRIDNGKATYFIGPYDPRHGE